ncbi:thiamine pyrophosphate-dependent enzyme, putative carboligase or decarboxylase [Actinoalloteichus fjordicus]|uniref:Thiamine pyrophosphate-dependent enzyme, putative carboligase or decarboxylase n=2 Tax=Actinoalloteichus fjordicus TaxID=1612552 RepID=A0AAC9LAX7_9PSEU|nr:thiamine pyrophosphate-dependent enzyme, putative carboligase or decarboxylase [Actinoalloteichus fjordicus]
MESRPGKVAVFEQFAADGMKYMFGNPGTVEQGLLDAGREFDLDYILALQESVAVGMADGYARATQRPALVQLHTGVGLGNGIGMLYQALRGGSPLVVIAGDAGIRYDAMDAQMAVDLVAMAEPVTKFATRVVDPGSVLRVLRRAVKIAMTPPRGPVFVGLPADVLDELTAEPVVPSSIPSTRVLPEPSLVAAAATRLLAGPRRLILMGDGVALSGAQRELTSVAEALGAEVWGVNSSEVNFDTTHPLYGGGLGHMFGAASARVVQEADSVLIVGTYVFPEVFPSLASPFKPGAQLVHIDLDSYEIAKNFPVDLGIVADPKLTLGAIAKELQRRLPAVPAPAGAVTAAPAVAEPPSSDIDDSVLERFVRRLGERAPEDLVLFDEALTASPPLARHLPPRHPGRFFQTRGGSLGVGIPGALGIKLARPELPVVAFTGDGGSMYTIQALWTAARYGIGAKFVICNNRRYRLLDQNIDQYWSELDIPRHQYPDAFDLSSPDIGFTELAGALGVPGRRVTRLYEVDGAIEAMLAHDGPFLVDLVIE